MSWKPAVGKQENVNTSTGVHTLLEALQHWFKSPQSNLVLYFKYHSQQMARNKWGDVVTY